MRQRDRLWPIFLPVPHGFRESTLLPLAQMPGQRILANDQGQLNIRQKTQELLAPFFRTFRPWCQIAGFPGSRIAKPHGKKGNSATVIKGPTVNSHPVTQTIAAWIIEGNSSLVYPPARRLRGNKNAGGPADLKNWSRPQRQMGFADFACLYSRDRYFKVTRHKPGYRTRLGFRPAPSAQAQGAVLPASSRSQAIASRQSSRLAGTSASLLQHHY